LSAHRRDADRTHQKRNRQRSPQFIHQNLSTGARMLMLLFRPGRRIQHHDRPLLRVLGNNARYARIVKLNVNLEDPSGAGQYWKPTKLFGYSAQKKRISCGE
jgi:hypothetical protein